MIRCVIHGSEDVGRHLSSLFLGERTGQVLLQMGTYKCREWDRLPSTKAWSVCTEVHSVINNNHYY